MVKKNLNMKNLIQTDDRRIFYNKNDNVLKGNVQRDLRGSNVTSFDRSRFKDVPLGLKKKFYSATMLYFS
jgi:hypothetical protein